MLWGLYPRTISHMKANLSMAKFPLSEACGLIRLKYWGEEIHYTSSEGRGHFWYFNYEPMFALGISYD